MMTGIPIENSLWTAYLLTIFFVVAGFAVYDVLYRRVPDRALVFFIPLAALAPEEIEEAYEKNTGLVIIETFETRGIKPMYTPAVLCKNHGPFTWGKDAAEAVHNAVVLEEVAKMAKNTELLNPKVLPAPDCIKEKHFYRKHGANAYYGQN